MTIIKPTIGRRVWYRPNGTNGLAMAVHDNIQPMDAGIVYVWGDRMVNLDVTDHNGNHHAIPSVTLYQEGDPLPTGAYCEWMPFQKGQATKQEGEGKASA